MLSNPRKGQWVIFKGEVGILNSFEGTNGEMHIVNNEGETVEVLTTPLKNLQEATYADIPQSRLKEKEQRAFAKTRYSK